MSVRVAFHLSLFVLILVTQSTNCMNEEKNKIVCDQWCRNATCEITDSGLMCSEGCVSGFTGYRCKEHCPERCKGCHQFTGECIPCVDGKNGDNCTSTSSLLTSTTTLPSQCVEMCAKCTHGDQPCQVCLNGTNCHDECGCIGTLHSTTSVSTISTPDSYSHTTTPRLPRNDYESDNFWNKIIGTIALTISSLVVMCLAIVCCRKYSIYWKKRNTPSETQLTESEMMMQNATRRESNPYAFVAVIDRDCVPDHLLQAAMMTAPPIIPDSSSEFNPYCEIQWNI